MSVNITTNSSRLLLGNLLSIDNIEFLDILYLPDYTSQTGDQQYIVQDIDTIDSIAYAFYGDPILWWVIAWANDFELLPTDLIVNDSIIIPDQNFVKSQLLTGKYRPSI
jgi:hypothetical protein